MYDHNDEKVHDLIKGSICSDHEPDKPLFVKPCGSCDAKKGLPAVGNTVEVPIH